MIKTAVNTSVALTSVALIGVGRMGRRHLQIIRDLGLRLVGVCDSNPGALDQAAKEFGVSSEYQFTEFGALMKKAQPECVIVATTAPTHCRLTCQAAETGAKYILCEKPTAVSLDECDQMIKVCKQYGAKLAINHQMRFMEQYTEPKRIVHSDEFGGLTSVTVVAGNFGMAMNGTHYFEMFRYMTDEKPLEVTAWFSNEKLPNPRGEKFEDRAGAVRITTAQGKRFYMETGSDQGQGVKVIYSGPYGQLMVDELAGTMNLSVREEKHRNLPTTSYGMPWIETVQKIAPADSIGPSKAVLEALVNSKNPPTGEDGRLAVAALVAAYVSDEKGHVSVRLDDPHLPLERTFPWA